MGHFPICHHSLRLSCSCLTIADGRGPSSTVLFDEPVKCRVLLGSRQHLRCLGAGLGPHTFRLLSERKFCILSWAWTERSLVHVHFSREEEDYFPWVSAISGTARAPSLPELAQRSVYLGKNCSVAAWRLDSGNFDSPPSRLFSCEACGDMRLLILVRRHLPRWLIPGNIRSHQSSFK